MMFISCFLQAEVQDPVSLLIFTPTPRPLTLGDKELWLKYIPYKIRYPFKIKLYHVTHCYWIFNMRHKHVASDFFLVWGFVEVPALN